MILTDANLLLYSYNTDAAEHRGSRGWLPRISLRFPDLQLANPLTLK
jgi:hypothetical protein